MSPKTYWQIAGCVAIVAGIARWVYMARLHNSGALVNPFGMFLSLGFISSALLGFGVGCFYKRPVLVAFIFVATYGLALGVLGSIPDALNAWSAWRSR